jgi:hypothetical protein
MLKRVNLPAVVTKPKKRLRVNPVCDEAALAFARQFIASMQEGEFMGLGCTAVHPDAGHRVCRYIMKKYAERDDVFGAGAMLRMMDYARAGWDDADIALREMIADHNRRHEPLPPFLETYNAEIVLGLDPQARGQPGTPRAANLVQDLIFMVLMMELCDRFGLKPTTFYYAARLPSATSVAARAAAESGLHRGGADAMAKIWQRYAHAVVPGYESRPRKKR